MTTKDKYILPEDPNEFLQDLVDAYPPNDFPSLRKIIGIGKVQYQDELSPGVPMTAAVKNTKPYTLFFGKKFLTEKTETIEDCVYILAHELTHLVLDHFARDILEDFTEKKLGYPAMHIIVDCQVNATCYNSLKEEKYFNFVKSYYSKDQMPYCFFRPDGEPPTQDLKDLHKKLYSKFGITNKELIEGLMTWFEEEDEKLSEYIKNLLGNHNEVLKEKISENNDDSLNDLIEGVSKDIQESLSKEDEKEDQSQEKNENTNQPEEKETSNKKYSSGGKLREKLIQQSLDKLDYIKNIKRNLNKVEVVSPSSRIYKAIEAFYPKTTSRTVIPNFYDRRTSAMYSKGVLPIFHNNKQRGSKVIIPCYLDVSGSQDHVIPYTVPAVTRLKQKIGNVVYCFSTMVAETAIKNLEVGKIQSTGGTCFNIVIEHILKNNFKSAIILTDGAAPLSLELREKAKKRRINITVGWTEKNPNLEPLSSIANKTFYVFEDR